MSVAVVAAAGGEGTGMKITINVFFFSNLLLAVRASGVWVRASGEYKYRWQSTSLHKKKLDERGQEEIVSESMAVHRGRTAVISASAPFGYDQTDSGVRELPSGGRHFTELYSTCSEGRYVVEHRMHHHHHIHIFLLIRRTYVTWTHK